MGRPLHKRNFGNGNVLTGPQIRVYAVFDSISGPEEAYIVRQKGTYWFDVKDVATDTKEMRARLVAKDAASLNVGEMYIDTFTTSTTLKARSVQAHRVKAVDTTNDTIWDVPWHYDAPTPDRAKLDNV